jgi:hypothetical protein
MPNMRTTQCPSCGHTVQATTFCSDCGAELRPREDSAGIIESAGGNAADLWRDLRRSPKRVKLIAAGVAALILLIALPAALSGLPSNVYKKAAQYFASGDYPNAYETVQKLDSDYKDVYILKPYYKAHADYRRGDYKAAWDAFADFGQYANSSEMAKESAYQYANWLEKSEGSIEGLAEARSIYQELGDFRDAADKADLRYWDYERAANLMRQGSYSAAKGMFAAMEDYKDSASMVSQCDYLFARDVMNSGDYDEAKALFAELGNYSDSASMISECDYIQAGGLFNEGAYSQAKAIYDSIANYKDASGKSAECDAQLAAARERAKELLIGKWLKSETEYNYSFLGLSDHLVFIDGKNLDVWHGNIISHDTYEVEGYKLTVYTPGLLGSTVVYEFRFGVSADGETLTVRDKDDVFKSCDYNRVAEP